MVCNFCFSNSPCNKANIFLGLIEYELNSLLGASHLVDYILVHIQFDLERYLLIMSIYIGNDFEDRLKILETENASLKEYNDYHQVVHEIDHMSDLHVDSSFYKQLMKIDNYFKITEWADFLIGQSRVIQELDKKRPKLSSLNQTQNRRRYVNFENGFHSFVA